MRGHRQLLRFVTCLCLVGCGDDGGGAGDAGLDAMPSDAGGGNVDAYTPMHDSGAFDAGTADADAGNSACTEAPPSFVVEDYGAVGDGITDDAAAIQAAIDAAAAAGGGSVVFAPTTYRLGADGVLFRDERDGLLYTEYQSGIVVRSSHISLEGDGTRLLADPGLPIDAVVLVSGTVDEQLTDISVTDFVIDAIDGLESLPDAQVGLRTRFVDHLFVDGVIIDGGYVSFTLSERVSHAVVRRSSVTKMGEDGFNVSGTNTLEEDDPHHVAFVDCASAVRGGGNDWEIEDGADYVSLFDVDAEGRVAVQNHPMHNRVSEYFWFVNVSTYKYFLIARAVRADGTLVMNNWIRHVYFYAAEAPIFERENLEDVNHYPDAVIARGSTTMACGVQRLSVAAPEVTESSAVFAVPASSPGERHFTVDSIEPGVGFALLADAPLSRDVALDYWVATP